MKREEWIEGGVCHCIEEEAAQATNLHGGQRILRCDEELCAQVNASCVYVCCMEKTKAQSLK